MLSAIPELGDPPALTGGIPFIMGLATAAAIFFAAILLLTLMDLSKGSDEPDGAIPDEPDGAVEVPSAPRRSRLRDFRDRLREFNDRLWDRVAVAGNAVTSGTATERTVKILLCVIAFGLVALNVQFCVIFD